MNLTFADIEAAAQRISPYVIRTPILKNAQINALTGAEVWFKAENLQLTGSFKIRGALNRLLQLNEEERASGVVAWSSGNHAQGIAEAARIVRTQATIVMPSDAPAAKIRGTQSRDADIVFYDRATQSRETIARQLAEDSGALLVPSYDDYDIMAGQGTCGLELAKQVAEFDVVLVPCGGGGLAAGVGTAIKHLTNAEIHLVEPIDFDDHARSFVDGQRQSNTSASGSICDALLASSPGELTFPINQAQVTRVLTVTDQEVVSAMRIAFEHLKVVLEPGGAVCLAALLKGQHSGQRVAAIVSGGNVDAELYSHLIFPE